MATVVTINRPDVVAQIEALALRLTGGNKTEVVALALRNLEECTPVPDRSSAPIAVLWRCGMASI